MKEGIELERLRVLNLIREEMEDFQGIIDSNKPKDDDKKEAALISIGVLHDMLVNITEGVHELDVGEPVQPAEKIPSTICPRCDSSDKVEELTEYKGHRCGRCNIFLGV